LVSSGAIVVALWLASGPAPVARDLPITIAGCSDELTTSLPALVSLEVDVLMRERGAKRAPPETVAVRCGGGAGDQVVIEVARSGARRESTVALAGMAPEHRARALALAVAELVDALAAAAPQVPPASQAPASPSVPQPSAPAASPVPVQAERTADPPAAPPAVRSSSVLVGGTVEWLGQPAALLLGGRLTYQHRPSEFWGALLAPMLSLGGSAGDASTGAGHVAARTLAGAAHVLVGVPLGRFRVEAGPGLRFGWAHLAGVPSAGSALDGRALTARWGGPELCLRATAAARGWPRLALELGAGWVAFPVRGLVDGGPAAYALQGAWLSAALQLGLDLDFR
jgi:hypothetical protein